MTHWNFKHNPNGILISKTDEGQPEVILGTTEGCLHGSLIEVAHYFAPGDIVETPEGKYLMQNFVGEGNN
jgi:hypothetical protein